MKTTDAIAQRRSIKKFTDRPVTREQIAQLIDAATQAPNHRLTQPWRFYVLGPEARHAFGLVLGERKAKKQPDAAKGAALRDTVAAEHRALPAMIGVAVVESTDAEQREEDYAATMMAVQNLMIAATALGLGTSLKTGGVMADPAARAAVGVPEGQRIVATIALGQPSEVPPPKPRVPGADLTMWRP